MTHARKWMARIGLPSLIIALFATVAPATPASAADYLSRKWYVNGATVSLMRSTTGWAWVTVSNAGGRSAEAGVWSAQSGWRYTPSYGNAPGWFSTAAVFTGGGCASVHAVVANNSYPWARGALNVVAC